MGGGGLMGRSFLLSHLETERARTTTFLSPLRLFSARFACVRAPGRGCPCGEVMSDPPAKSLQLLRWEARRRLVSSLGARYLSDVPTHAAWPSSQAIASARLALNSKLPLAPRAAPSAAATRAPTRADTAQHLLGLQQQDWAARITALTALKQLAFDADEEYKRGLLQKDLAGMLARTLRDASGAPEEHRLKAAEQAASCVYSLAREHMDSKLALHDAGVAPPLASFLQQDGSKQCQLNATAALYAVSCGGVQACQGIAALVSLRALVPLIYPGTERTKQDDQLQLFASLLLVNLLHLDGMAESSSDEREELRGALQKALDDCSEEQVRHTLELGFKKLREKELGMFADINLTSTSRNFRLMSEWVRELTHSEYSGAALEPDAVWAAIVQRWGMDETDGIGATPLTAAETALAEAAAACVATAQQAPCTHCGNCFAEQWGSAPWHCFACKKPLEATARAAPEEAAKAASTTVDAPFVTAEGALTAEGQARHAARGVRVRFLLQLLGSLPAAIRSTVTTGEVVALLVKPATARRRCRFVELPAMRDLVGAPRAFVSHVWSGLFTDLVAAIAHAIPEDECVWCDIL